MWYIFYLIYLYIWLQIAEYIFKYSIFILPMYFQCPDEKRFATKNRFKTHEKQVHETSEPNSKGKLCAVSNTTDVTLVMQVCIEKKKLARETTG